MSTKEVSGSVAEEKKQKESSCNCAAEEWKSVEEFGMPPADGEVLVSDDGDNCALALWGEGMTWYNRQPVSEICWHHKTGWKIVFPIKYWTLIRHPNV